MKVQTPKSIKKIASEVERYIVANYPHVSMIEDVSLETQYEWESKCNHELYYQDVNRFIGDVYNRESLNRPAELSFWR